jgi:dipeptidyl aminopeptidase/acylaminoacyl peptidase
MFKAAVPAGEISDFYSFFEIGDGMYVWCEENSEEQPWNNEELYLLKSPIRYVQDVTTPTLILWSITGMFCWFNKYLGVR